MSAFVVVLHDDEPQASATLRERIEEKYPDSEHYRLSEYTYLVTGPRLVSDVAESLGMTDDENLYAAILRLNGSFSGRSWTDLWDWLRAAEGNR